VPAIKSLGLCGVDSYEVLVECDLANALPAFAIVGLPDAAVKESKERVIASLKECGCDMFNKRITVNLAPAATKKAGAVYDLPILLSVLLESGRLNESILDYAFAGELSLSAELRPIPGILPMAIGAKALGLKGFFVPADNAEEAAIVDGIDIFPVSNVMDILSHFAAVAKEQDKYDSYFPGGSPMFISPMRKSFSEYLSDNCDEIGMDFSDVVGAETAKRAAEIAAAGGHNMMLIGAPGAGKSMLAKLTPTILPNMSFEEAISTTKIYSVASLLTKENPFIASRPFRSPHHTISSVGLSGGGSYPRPGEISLAHNGVLFLDEFPEFSSQSIEVMRSPIEDCTVTVSRASGSVTYPCAFTLICAMNPCKCGYFGHPTRKCTCSDMERSRYLKRISGPILDRIDIQVEVKPCKYDDLRQHSGGESSAVIKKRVDAARLVQQARLDTHKLSCNARLTPSLIRKYCKLTQNADLLLKSAFEKLSLSARAHDRILKVARTIADLAGSEQIDMPHIAEAIQYRCLDRKYF